MECQCTCTSPEHPNEKFVATISKDIFTFNAMKMDKEIAPRRSEMVNTKTNKNLKTIPSEKIKKPEAKIEKNKLNNIWDVMGIKQKKKINPKKVDNSVTNKKESYNVWQSLNIAMNTKKGKKSSNTNVWGLIKGVGKRHNNANNSLQGMNQLDHTIISNEFNSITQPTGNTNHRNSNNWMQQNNRNNHKEYMVQNHRDNRNNNHVMFMDNNHVMPMDNNHGNNMHHGSNINHKTNIGHRTNIGHGTNIGHETNIGHKTNFGHETNINHGINGGHGTNLNHGSNNYHGTNINHGSNNYHGNNNNHGTNINHGNSWTSQNTNYFRHNNEHWVQENNINNARYYHHQEQQNRNHTNKSNWSDHAHNHYPGVHHTNQGHVNSQNFNAHETSQRGNENSINRELFFKHSLGKPEKSSKTLPMPGTKPRSVFKFPAWKPWQPVQTNNKTHHSQTGHVNVYDLGHTQWTTTVDPLNANNTDIEPIERELVH
ncbi:unnamed protein product [Mytilus coruscus]|uniref:GATA zinc finger domain-containing protein 14-like n=1 Tax=Mytilus coruscus TaxID=42192 RepID=A0A6J8BIE6_MYTCO|nr:unnamed protein product [Mytilus coruscus]